MFDEAFRGKTINDGPVREAAVAAHEKLVGDASGPEAYGEPPAPDDKLPKAQSWRFSTQCGMTGIVGGDAPALHRDGCVRSRCPTRFVPVELEKSAKTPNTPEPAPKPGVARATWSLVMADMLERDATGAAKYGIRHQHDNGRDHLVDAYQECLDLALYLRAEIEKRKAVTP